MTFQPPTIEEVEAYVKEKNLAVDPQWFWDFFEAGDWIDTRGTPVRSWKQKLWTHHRMNLARGGSHKCSAQYCKKPGIYIAGKDRDGHPYYYCIDHKPKPKPLPLPAEVIPTMKRVPDKDKRSTSDKVNAARKLLSKS